MDGRAVATGTGRCGLNKKVSRLALLFALTCCVALAGCSSRRYLLERNSPFNPLTTTLNLLSREGPQPSERTQQILRRYDLTAQQRRAPGPVLIRLQEELNREPTLDKYYAFAELSYLGGLKAQHERDRDRVLDYYAAAVSHAYLYLFDPRFQDLRTSYDPIFRQACDLYNTALESALRLYCPEGRLRVGPRQPVKIGNRTIEVDVVLRGAWRDDEIERLEFVSDYQIENLSNRHRTYGLGVPLIAIRKMSATQDHADRYYPPGLSFAVTAFLRVMPHSPKGHTACVLEINDPLTSRFTTVGNMAVPLETDLTTPLAYFLDTPEFNEKTNIATLGLLNPNRTLPAAGLFMVEPYQPDKIPVLFVHGLWSSPMTWMEMFNDLRSFPEIRERYQFWFYLYPTGQPFWVSASHLRDDLAAMREAVDPHRQSAALDQMVLVAHSMGGLVSRLQTIDSREDFWKIVSDRPFEELKADDEARSELAKMFFFTPNSSIRHVVSIGTPHRGSNFANDYTRWIGRRLIRLPHMLVSRNQRLILSNPGLFRNPELLTINTGIDSLSPDSPMLPVILQANKAPWVTYHNIVGVVPDQGIVGKLAAESDGVVSFASAHLPEAASEVVVTADHVTVHQHPRSILEVRRILLENLQSYAGAKGLAPAAPTAAAARPAAVTPELRAPGLLPPQNAESPAGPSTSGSAGPAEPGEAPPPPALPVVPGWRRPAAVSLEG